jgi:hypothetical protein
MITPSFGRWLRPALGAVLALAALRAADAARPLPLWSSCPSLR